MKSKLAILLICKSLPWRFKGGIQTHTWDLAQALQQKGNAVTILTGGSFFKKEKTTLLEGIQIIDLPYFPGRYVPFISFLAEEFAFNQQVKSWVNGHHAAYDIIHAQGRSGYLLYQNPKLHSKIIQTIHGMTGIESEADSQQNLNTRLHRFFAERWENRLLQVSSKAITVSEDLKASVILQNQNSAYKINVIPNGVSQMNNAKRGNQALNRFVFVGRLHPVKGLVPLIHAIATSETKIYLDIIGEGPQRKDLDQLVADLHLSDQVRLFGAFDNAVVQHLLPHYKALVLPSIYESQGIVLLEANLRGIPVIASDIPSIRETVTSGVNGLLCDLAQPESFVLAMKQLIDNPHYAKKLGAQGKELVLSNYSWNSIADQTIALYHQIAS
ncbi:glycosyltransferase family 4 protein [Algoriphagus sp.]|uniref:glycosyltransferase family 4 protein n=1 Tax=Algoriphagus sp. TaxID=1872435 RepID=UPI00327278E9